MTKAMQFIVGFLVAGILLSGTVVGQEKADSGYINFSFDKVSVSAFVKLVGDITGKKFVVSDDVSGKVTIVSPRVSPEEVYPLFVSILESSGCSVLREGEIYRIVSLPERKTPMGNVIGSDEITPSEGVITKIIHLEYVSASELNRILQSSVRGGGEGAIASIDETNHLIVTDTADSIKRIEKIVDEIDKPGLARTTEVVFLKYANASDLAEQLNAAIQDEGVRQTSLQNRLPRPPSTGNSSGLSSGRRKYSSGLAVIASQHSNSLLLVGTPTQNKELKNIIQKMDVDSPSGRGHLNAIFLKYIQAKEAAQNITSLLTQLDRKKDYDAKRNIAVAASIENNALIIDAMPGDFEMVRKLVEQLDKLPEQVHITVMIAETSLGEGYNLGVEMAAFDMPDAVGSTVVQGSSRLTEGVDSIMNSIQSGIFPSGLSAGIAYGSREDAQGNIISSHPGLININAIRKDSNFNVLSETSLEAQNNKEASVNIVNEIPILKSTVSGVGDSRDVIQNIERIEVGIKLHLTPHVIPGGEVQMELNPSIEAVIDPGPSDTPFAPTIARRQVKTTVTVPDGQTIVIAGLTREDTTEIVKRVPILGSIPLIGWLFRNTVKEEQKTNLMIFVTPRIVSNMKDADTIMQTWKDKTGINNHDAE